MPRPKPSRRASFSVVDTLSMERLSHSEDLKQSSHSKEEDAGGTAASTVVSGDDNASTQSYSHTNSTPRRRGRRSILGLGRSISRRMSLGFLLDENNNKNNKSQKSDNLLGCSSNSLTSLGMDDSMDMTPFEMEMKARSLLTDVRKRIKQHKEHEKELIISITRHTELALARSSGVGALISMKKVKKQQLELGRVASAIGYLETQELDLMADIEEAKQKNLEGNQKDYEWPIYEDFEIELEYILAPANEKESLAWTDDELLHDLAKLRRAPQRAARHYSMD